jgi:hypothetical protein
MAQADLTAILELGVWSLLPDGREAQLNPTKNPRRFRIVVRPRERRQRVRHRKYPLREEPQIPNSGD